MSDRVPANTLKVTAAILVSWMAFEGFSSSPIIPTKGDVPTIGHGATHYEDGTKVKMGDAPITRQRGEELAKNLLEKTYGQCVRKSLGSTLIHEKEFEQAVDFSGQFGCYRWEQSSMLRHLKQGNYIKSCESYLLYKYSDKFDCSTPGNKRCWGVWARQLKRYDNCMSVQ